MDMSINPAGRKSMGMKTPSKGPADDMDETTFDGSGIFAGTQGGDALNMQGALDRM